MGTPSDTEQTATPDTFGLVGTRLDGKYDVDAVVAEGGFGVVYRATHIALRKPVAVKVLKVPPELASPARKMFLDRFAQEAQTIAALDHPAIVRVMDFGASLMPQGEAAPWMVLEWLTGVTLDDDLEARRGRGGRGPAECLALLRPVFEALAYAHDEGIAHRDIKPPNLMLVVNKRGERAVRVLDFGIAKVMTGEEGASASGHTATQTQQRAFSLLYAAPEQLSGTRTGPWTDVYALALVLTEMLTDLPAYDGNDVSDIYVDALSPRRPTPAKRGFDVGPWEPVLARAVALKPAERFANAREFLAALEASVPASVRAPSVLPEAPVPSRLAQPPDTFEHAKTVRDTTPSAGQARGSRTVVIGAALLVALGLVVGAVSYVVASRHTQADVQAARPPTPRPSEAVASSAPAAALVPPPAAVAAQVVAVEADAGATPAAGATAPMEQARRTGRPPVARAVPRVGARVGAQAIAAPAAAQTDSPPAAPRPVTGHEHVVAE